MHLPVGGDNAYFLDLYARYRRDPASVPADWALHFETTFHEPRADAPAARYLGRLLLDAYRTHGHMEADLDPLGLSPRGTVRQLDELRAEARGAEAAETEVTFAGHSRRVTLGALLHDLPQIYAGRAALEASHLADDAGRDFLHAAMETAFTAAPDPEALGRALGSIARADAFEAFCRIKFPTKKRFGSEGGEAATALLCELLAAAADDVDEVVMGGMHRGRLALLATVLGKPLPALFSELKGRDLTGGDAAFTGDVPYHLGYTGELVHAGRAMRVRLLPHPSHLAVVGPVTLGHARAVQAASGSDPSRTLCVVLHTDAAFAGQGVNGEVMQLGGLAGYSVGGTVHVVVNNQIGFTTLPSEGRSSRYCTDAGKAAGVPVLHVNADDPLAVVRVAGIAAAWRRRFARDILIDFVCYRRHGHNELDEPRFTQPAAWARIERHPTVRESFGAVVRAMAPDVAARAEAQAAGFLDEMAAGYAASGAFRGNGRFDQGTAWEAIAAAGEDDVLQSEVATGVPLDELRRIGARTCDLPAGFAPHWKVGRFYAARAACFAGDEPLNFATAEALAFASLLGEGIPIRLSGQDAVRGTFTQRHLALHAEAEGSLVPLAAAATNGARMEAINSPLSENAVLGFEYGYSLADPMRLVVWEAQFGDFLNCAQAMVDQYVASAEAKWGVRSSLVLLLPHGLEGQGPDHSSARIERILQLCAGANVVVANPSTPANLFHLLRRQVRAPWRKPLFVIAPKSLLRAKAAASPLAEMGPGTAFRPLLGDPAAAGAAVRRIVLCSGKVAYELAEARAAAGRTGDVAIVRVEQLYPFPRAALAELVARHPRADLVWCQEEPENQGAWHHVRRALQALAPLGYAGRPALPVAAAGAVERHEAEQRALLACALDLACRTSADGCELQRG